MVEWPVIITLVLLIVICHLIVENQALDPLLFLSVRLLLASHGNRKIGVRRQVDGPRLQ